MTDWIATMESGLRLTLVPELRALYEGTDGEEGANGWVGPASAGRPMRLMSSEEVLETNDNFRGFVRMRDSAIFWMNGNGEYAAVFLAGPLAGRIYFFTNDGRNDSISFRSVNSLIAAMNELAAADSECPDYQDLRTDYYVETEYYIRGDAVRRPASADEFAADRDACRRLREEYASATIADEFDEHHYAMNIMALTPDDETETLDEFLKSEDMWIQAQACNILGHRRYEPRIAELGEIARTGTTNGRGAAVRALGRIGTATARQELIASAPHFTKGDHWNLSAALEACGCEVRKDNIDPRGIKTPDYLYRVPGESEWRTL